MKKLAVLLIIASVFFMGCVTTPKNHVSDAGGYKPQVNMFEKRKWISLSEVELFQDETSLYVYIRYSSERAGKYSIFDSPSGNVFKHQGDIESGAGELLQKINKDSLSGIEGMTALFFPGDFSNESDSFGLFINREEINLRQIPVKPGNLKVSEVTDLSQTGKLNEQDNNTNSDFPSGQPYRIIRNADWFETKEVNFYRNNDKIYIHLGYVSDFESTYRLFGGGLSVSGFCSQGEGEILIPISEAAKDTSAEIKLSIGYGNEESIEFLLLNPTALFSGNLSQKPESLIVDEYDVLDDDEDLPWSTDITLWKSTKDDVIEFMGRAPDIYLWENERYTSNNLPDTPYLMKYLKGNGDDDITYLALGQEGNKIAEIRIHSDQWDFYNIKIGQTLDDVFDIIGHPKKTVIDEEIGYNHLVLNKDINGEIGSYHIHHRQMGVGVYFKEGIVHDIFIYARGISK